MSRVARCRRRRCSSAPRRRQLEGTGRVVGDDGAGGGGEDAVRVGRGADVDLDPAAEPIDVGAQHPVVGKVPGRRGQGARLRGLPGRPGVAGSGVQAVRRGAARRRSARRRAGRPPRRRRDPPRRSARAPAATRSATTASSGLSTAAARCQAYRSGSSAGSMASASARCASRRSLLVAAWYTADRTSGCRTPTLSPSTTSRPGAFRGVDASGSTPRTAAARARRDVTGVVSRGDQQQGLNARRQAAAPVEEDPFDAGGEMQLGRQRRGAGQLLGGQRAGELDEGQRVPGGLGHQPVRDDVGHGGAGHFGEEHAGRVTGQRRQCDSRDVVGCERAALAVASGEHDRDPVGTEPSRRRPAPRRWWPGRATARRR